ncbi:MAG: prepilin-type N-terminal cleavage/methylation domain-containing protein [Patescibacteria group bacterium]
MIESLKSKRGFTLIELIIVVVILGILILIVLAATRGDKNKASDQSIRATGARIAQALEDCYVEGTGYPAGADITAIIGGICVGGKFDNPPTTTGLVGSSTAAAFSITGTLSDGTTFSVTNKQ